MYAPLRRLFVCLVTAGCGFEWEPLFHERIDPAALDGVTIAPADEALTFARTADTTGGFRLIAVRDYADGFVEGIDVAAAAGRPVDDPIEYVADRPYDEVRAELAAGRTDVRVPVATLTIPVALRAHHIAAGTNFPEHADDVGVRDGPFLFPKLVAPTAPDAEVSMRGGLLDYEVEVAWVPFTDVPAAGPVPERLGLVLCNDFTDRDVLLRRLDPKNPASGVGFTTGKSFPGYLPVGDLFLVPRDHRAFVAGLSLQLYVNFGLRQRDRAQRMVWDVDRLFEQSAARSDVTWAHAGKRVGLFEPDAPGIIRARAMILSGTPAGTVFTELTPEQKASGFADWFFALGTGSSIQRRAVRSYIADARAAGVYLRPGDRVDIHVHRMGTLRNRIVR